MRINRARALRKQRENERGTEREGEREGERERGRGREEALLSWILFFNGNPAGPSMFDGLHEHRFTPKWAPGALRVPQEICYDVSRTATSQNWIFL